MDDGAQTRAALGRVVTIAGEGAVLGGEGEAIARLVGRNQAAGPAGPVSVHRVPMRGGPIGLRLVGRIQLTIASRLMRASGFRPIGPQTSRRVTAASRRYAVGMATIAAARPQLERRARLLAWGGNAWHVVEFAIAVGAGIAASSVALVAFGIDSLIEVAAGGVILWLFSGGRGASAAAERQAQQIIAFSFYALAVYVVIASVRSFTGTHPEASSVGIGLALVTAPTMPLLARAKRRVGRQLGSRATESEGQQNMICAYLSIALLARTRRERGVRVVVGRPAGRPRDRRRRRARGSRGMARRDLRRLLLIVQPLVLTSSRYRTATTNSSTPSRCFRSNVLRVGRNCVCASTPPAGLAGDRTNLAQPAGDEWTTTAETTPRPRGHSI